MAIVKFELKENHLKLLKHLSWKIGKDNSIETLEVENGTPYGGISLVEDAGLILHGKPDGDFDPLSSVPPQYSDEQIEEIEELYDELPLALEVVTYLRTFKLGHYKKKYNSNHWKEYKPRK